MVNGLSSSIAEPKEMITPQLREALTKQGYRLVGSHSGVKLCRWTKVRYHYHNLVSFHLMFLVLFINVEYLVFRVCCVDEEVVTNTRFMVLKVIDVWKLLPV